MKLSQGLFLIVIIDVIMLVVSFAILNQDITQIQDSVIDKIDNKIGDFEVGTTSMQRSDNWLIKLTQDIVQGMSNTINLAIIGVKIIGLVIGSFLFPMWSILLTGEEVTMLRILGSIGILYIYWFNIQTAMKLYSYIKGSTE